MLGFSFGVKTLDRSVISWKAGLQIQTKVKRSPYRASWGCITTEGSKAIIVLPKICSVRFGWSQVVGDTFLYSYCCVSKNGMAYLASLRHQLASSLSSFNEGTHKKRRRTQRRAVSGCLCKQVCAARREATQRYC